MDKYLVTLGHKWGGGYYAKSVTDDPHWLNSYMHDFASAVVIEVGFDPKTGEATAKVLKNTPAETGL